MDNIFLVKLPYRDSHYNFYLDLPAGLAVLSEALIYNGIEHELYDMQLNNSADAFFLKVDEYDPEYIGFSMMTFRYLQNYRFINSVKKRYPSKKIIIGGPHASTLREKILEDCEGADIVAMLEGEDILSELCSGKPINEIKGIIYRENGLIRNTGTREFIMDLDKYPFPRLSKFDLSNYSIIPIVTSRGCPYSCVYCPISTTIGKKWRPRKAEKIVDELEYWSDKGYRNIQIQDDNFTLKRDRVLEICDGIKQRGIEVKMTLTNGIRADRVDKKLLRIMKETGFYQIAFGVESGNDRVLQSLQKGEKLETIENAIEMACDLDFEVGLFFVLGAPGETEDDVLDSIRVAKKYPVTDIAFYHLLPFPGTKLYEWVEKNNKFRYKAPDYLDDADSWLNEPIFHTDELSIEKKKELYGLAVKESESHVNRVRTGKLARRITKRFKIPLSITMFAALVIRNPLIRKGLSDSFVTKWLKGMLPS